MYEQLYERMLKALIKGGITALTQATYDCLGLPVMITDAHYYCLAHLPDQQINDPLWDAIHKNGNTPISYIQLFNDEEMMKKGIKHREPYLLNWGFLDEHPRIIGNIFTDDTIAGYIAIPCSTISDDLIKAVSLICSVFSVEFQRRNVRFGSIPDAWSMFLNNLIGSKINEQEQLNQWLGRLHRRIKGDFCIVATQPAKGETEKSLLPFIQRNILQMDPSMYPVTYGDTIYFLVMGYTDQETRIKRIDYLISNLSSLNLRFGISNRFSDILQVGIYLDQASFTLYSCLKHSEARFLYYSDCILQRIFGDILNHIPVQSCIHPAIRELEQHDQKNGTEYSETLSTYILSMCDATATVTKLHIHRNTLPHRFEAIQRIAEIDLSDPVICAHLLCSYYILNTSDEKKMNF